MEVTLVLSQNDWVQRAADKIINLSLHVTAAWVQSLVISIYIVFELAIGTERMRWFSSIESSAQYFHIRKIHSPHNQSNHGC